VVGIGVILTVAIRNSIEMLQERKKREGRKQPVTQPPTTTNNSEPATISKLVAVVTR
jgi:hypothetical protein